ncbi:hypothetical protein N9948_01010 [bacterium]|nr:hypothetical protein [bacterium]
MDSIYRSDVITTISKLSNKLFKYKKELNESIGLLPESNLKIVYVAPTIAWPESKYYSNIIHSTNVDKARGAILYAAFIEPKYFSKELAIELSSRIFLNSVFKKMPLHLESPYQGNIINITGKPNSLKFILDE